jgi:LPXTG-site transpeptidase (sortase) family protein
MVPLSGLMILFGILMFGSALAIPATRAMQEASMRDRIASFANNGGSETTTDASVSGSTSVPNLPAYVELEDDEGDDSTEPVVLSRDSDKASVLSELRTGRVLTSPADAADEPEPVSMPSPRHLRIPAIEVDTEIVEVTSQVIEIDGQRVREWEVASYAAGHHDTSANPGEGGNIVITGHNDWEGEVFRTLEYVELGDEVFITTDEGEHRYVIEELHMRREVGVSLEERLATGQFMASMPEERVTLITCWPYGINDHRVIVVAKPAGS